MLKNIKIAVAMLALASISHAWSINGHLLVANIAQNLLEESAPDSLAAANQMLTYLAEAQPDFTTHEDQHAFVECATFADDYKYHGEAWQSDFHFIDYPFVDEGKESDYDINLSSRNLTDGISNIVAWLSDKQGTAYQSSYIYTYIMNEFDQDENVAKSYALRLLVHYMGDLVQPFHCENRFDSEFPDGDKGANLFPLKYHYDVDELHALWDKVLYTQHNNIARPFTTETWDEFQPEVTDMMDTYSYAVEDTSVYVGTDFDKYAIESYGIAITLYDGLTEDAAVPQEYLDEHIPIANEQITKGGYRLFYVINYIFGDSTNEETTVDQEAIINAWIEQVFAAMAENKPVQSLQ